MLVSSADVPSTLQYVSEVVIGAPYSVTEGLINHFKVSSLRGSGQWCMLRFDKPMLVCCHTGWRSGPREHTHPPWHCTYQFSHYCNT